MGNKNGNPKHGMSRHPVYKVYYAMRCRCLRPTNPSYKNYGARGISVTKEWSTFEDFWATFGNSWRPGLTIERIDNDGGYSIRNCRWVSHKENQQNKRTTKVYRHKGKAQTIKAWAKELKMPWNTIYNRVRRGQTFRQAIGA